jgi:peptide/nickel transport system permease protein
LAVVLTGEPGTIAEARAPQEWRYRWWGRLLRDPGAVVGAIILIVMIGGALLAPLIAPYDPETTDLRARNTPPAWEQAGSSEHWLGTDPVGRDMLSRIIYGARVSLFISFTVTVLATLIGVTFGLLAGYFGGVIDEALMRIADLFLVFPFILLAITVIAVLGSGLRNLLIVLVVTGWVQHARLVRGQVLGLRSVQYVEASRVAGASHTRLLVRHVLPNVLASVIVLATMQLAFVLLTEAALNFLGLGVDPSTPTWGSMISQGRTYIYNAWWVITFPGIAILLTVLAINLLGDWLRDTLDPSLRVV